MPLCKYSFLSLVAANLASFTMQSRGRSALFPVELRRITLCLTADETHLRSNTARSSHRAASLPR